MKPKFNIIVCNIIVFNKFTGYNKIVLKRFDWNLIG